MIVLKIILGIFAFVFILCLFAAALIGLQFMVWFKWRDCKYCHHTMEYKRLKEDDNNEYYLFHCPKCGSWEQVPREKFLRDIDKDINQQTV